MVAVEELEESVGGKCLSGMEMLKLCFITENSVPSFLDIEEPKKSTGAMVN
jgi:hypothetical protein